MKVPLSPCRPKWFSRKSLHSGRKLVEVFTFSRGGKVNTYWFDTASKHREKVLLKKGYISRGDRTLGPRIIDMGGNSPAVLPVNR